MHLEEKRLQMELEGKRMQAVLEQTRLDLEQKRLDLRFDLEQKRLELRIDWDQEMEQQRMEMQNRLRTVGASVAIEHHGGFGLPSDSESEVEDDQAVASSPPSPPSPRSHESLSDVEWPEMDAWSTGVSIASTPRSPDPEQQQGHD
ncbi:hypothetical protein G7Y89_g5194 [Cudoniella acicularis]|uniref:Uncharacterized protein n=1 Tax=Cudoniella acicularis TaxID=354080 RepID=A0A8H4RNR9_9HELO|nr:hypothetical protein G7Y89_g5194 [Cudoniella acicularis]